MARSDGSYRGVVGRTAVDSVPWWPDPVRPPAGAPNVVFLVFDDVGFSDFGCYGSEITTTNLDRLAAGGLRYTNFHTTALCSPTRACLLTGRNHHSVGMGGLADWDLGWPGHRGRITRSAGTLAEMLREEGYSTFAVGKWHLTPTQQTGPAGPFHQWPTQRGFDRFYGFLEGETNQWRPDLTEDNHPIDPPDDPAYHLTPDLVDRSIELVRNQTSAAPLRPFFLYLCFGACHAPHHVPRELVERYVPIFAKGWDRTREDRLRRQQAMGIVPSDTTLPERNPGVRAWDDLSDDQRRLAVRLQAAFAGMLEHTDQHIGRLLDALGALGRLDDTMFCVISDNGASQEGSPLGTVNAMRFFNGERDTLEDNLAHVEEIGEAHLNNNYPLGWAMAGNTPLKRYKQNTHGGGVRDPLIISWPRRIGERGGVRHQFHHVSDLVPTVLEVLGTPAPAELAGVAQQPLEGTSLAYTFAGGAAGEPSRKHLQYFEMLGHRGIWHRGWKAVTWHRPGSSFDVDRWELYHLDEDFGEVRDLAEQQPGKLAELQQLWWAEAGRYRVLPLEDRLHRWSAPGVEAGPRRHVLHPGYTHVPTAAAPDLRNRSYTISADVDVPDGGAEGVLVAHGDWCSGYSLYLQDGRLHHLYNWVGTRYLLSSPGPVPPGPHRLAFGFSRTGDHRGRGELAIDGEAVAAMDLGGTCRGLLSMTALHVGCDKLVPVGGYRAPFPFTGTLRTVTFELAEDQDLDLEAVHAAELARQ